MSPTSNPQDMKADKASMCQVLCGLLARFWDQSLGDEADIFSVAYLGRARSFTKTSS